MSFRIGWEMRIRAMPDSAVMENGPVGNWVEMAGDGADERRIAARFAAIQFYETVCRDLGIERESQVFERGDG